ncbi:MAG: CCA tRNA nucleotidyltransferase, partial [Pseudomonadota bacterium]
MSEPASLKDAEWLQDPALKAVLAAMRADGGEARIAGGAVRNALLGQPINDIDIATDQAPEDIIALAQSQGLSVHPTGLEHGTVTVVAGPK